MSERPLDQRAALVAVEEELAGTAGPREASLESAARRAGLTPEAVRRARKVERKRKEREGF